jgi:DNA-binding PadR family transcriptional regulator
MPVKHGLLALLASRDLTGYELKVRFERTLGDFWQLNSGQVYSTLERLRRAGLVRRESEAARLPARVARARYTLLPRGRCALERWLAEPAPRLRPARDPLFVKLVFTPPERLAPLLVAFAAEARRYADAVDSLTALVARQPMTHAGRTRWLVVEATRLQYAAQREWLDMVHRMLDPADARPARRGLRRLDGPEETRPAAVATLRASR